MMFDIVLVVWICICFNFCWHKISKQATEFDALTRAYCITRDKIKDLETRIRFLEMSHDNEAARLTLLQVESESYKI